MKTTHVAILRYFSHDKCHVCKVLLPKVKQLIIREFPQIHLEYINIETDSVAATQYQVFTAPAILIFFEGKEYYRFARNISINQLKEAIERPYNMLF